VRNFYFRIQVITLISLLGILFIFYPEGFCSEFLQDDQVQEQEIKKAKIYEDIYPLISESDLYCSFFVWKGAKPEIEIIGAEREYEKTLLNDGDIFYVNKGKDDGLEAGQVFLIVEIGSNIADFGPIAFKRGRAVVVDLEDHHASAKVEKSCGSVMVGYFLIPFEEKEGQTGKDLGYDVSPSSIKEGVKGQVIYLQKDFNQIGKGYWALIDIGEQDGIQVGQQLVIYRIVKEGTPVQVFGNIIVIDTQESTSTVKVLSCKDVIRLGDLVHVRPSE